MANKQTKLIRLKVNGTDHHVAAPAHHTLCETLRYQLQLTGTKQGCDKGDCGACTVLVDGNPVLSCLALNEAYACNEVQEPQIVTIEGLAQKDGLDPVQNAFDRCGALQCGFCQPGMMLSARALLQEKANPTIAEIRHALSGNLCRCTGYTKILEACLMAAIQENENVDDEVAYEKMRENQKASQHFDTGPETKNGVAS